MCLRTGARPTWTSLTSTWSSTGRSLLRSPRSSKQGPARPDDPAPRDGGPFNQVAGRNALSDRSAS
eukprot:9110600-Pyramimonas_sp.AAC.1